MTRAPDATSPASQVGEDHGSFSQEAKIPTEGREVAAVGPGEPCKYCGPGVRTGLPGNACENCMGTGLALPPEVEELEVSAWAWVQSRYPEDAISDIAFDADEMVDAYIAGASARQLAAQPDASQPGMSEANAPIPAVQSGAVAWRIDVPNGNYGFATSEAGAVNASRHSGGTITPLYAAPQSEPLPGGVGEALRAARDDFEAIRARLTPDSRDTASAYARAVEAGQRIDAALSGKEQG